MSLFSERLKGYREKLKEKDKKWTQKYVADKVGVARVTYTAYENGTKMPPFDTINSIADLFGIKTDYLMGRSDDPKLSETEEKWVVKETEELYSLIEKLPAEKRGEVWQKVLAYTKGITDAEKD